MLNSVDSPQKHGLKIKFGAVPAMLSLLSENPCTVILCLCLYFFEQREFTHSEFKRFLSCMFLLLLLHQSFSKYEAFLIFYIDILCADRAIPLHPHMMLDFLENEIGFDARMESLILLFYYFLVLVFLFFCFCFFFDY